MQRRPTARAMKNGLVGVLLGRRAPRGAGVVDQDVDRAEAAHRLLHHRRDAVELLQVARHREHIDAPGLQFVPGLRQLVGLARGDRHAAAHLTQRLGHLQA